VEEELAMNRPEEECVILGSGRSLLDLSDGERAYLNAHPNTLGMNRFLLYHEKVGIIPKAVFLADWHFPAQRIFVDLVRAARRLHPSPRFFAHSYYKSFFDRPPLHPIALRRFLGVRRRFYKKYGYWLPAFLPRVETTYFQSEPEKNSRPLFWARSLDEELYFHRGSLTTALNLVSVVYPVRKIKLLGIDLNGDKSFFAEEVERTQKHADVAQDTIAAQVGQHFTAIPHNGHEPIQAVIPGIVDRLRQDGIELVCSNQRSLLCQEQICRYEPLAP
jgi:hypothetical protein